MSSKLKWCVKKRERGYDYAVGDYLLTPDQTYDYLSVFDATGTDPADIARYGYFPTRAIAEAYGAWAKAAFPKVMSDYAREVNEDRGMA